VVAGDHRRGGGVKVIEPGHVYDLANSDGPDYQRVRFVRRRDAVGEPLPAREKHPGLLSQELIRVLIDRTLYLYAEAPCDEDTRIVEHLRAALSLYESRASRRAIEKLSKPEEADVCPICHHILCLHVRKLHPLAAREDAA
jgi:hypothetical protein